MVEFGVVLTGYSTQACVFLWCAVPAKQGQDELLYTQKHPGSPRSAETADGVQGS